MIKNNFTFPKFLCSLLVFFSLTVAFGQAPTTIEFRGETIEMPENIMNFSWDQLTNSSKLDKGYVGWVQFYETPSQETQDRFKNNDLLLMEYIPHQTYLFYFPLNTSINFLRENGVRSIVPLANRAKLSESLKTEHFESWAWDGDQLLISMEYFAQANLHEVLADLKQLGARTLEIYPDYNIVELAINLDDLDLLTERSYLRWAELITPPSVKDDNNGRGLHRSNNLDTQTSSGWDYTGRGVGVMVRDDGFVGPHIDFEGRITNYTSRRNQSHGDGVGGIMAGAGNLIPEMRGMAAGSDVHVVDYVATFLDHATTNLIDDGSVQITNSSYSNGCNDGYTSIARIVDMQTLATPSLMHVFSAGNSNGTNCGYGAGGQWGNITGGHKQGKNVVTTANVAANARLENSSSRGPATDGRLKPDITAHGQGQLSTNENNSYQSFGGTSAAAPGIAGVSAQLYELYADLNGGVHPQSALIKAAILNTANDAGNVGPDFKFGWGIINGLRAGKLIEDERYLSDEISQGDVNTHTINVPAGTKQVRFMVYWSDVEGAPNANPALVNDLDLTVKDPANNTLLPWILDHTPTTTALNTPAAPGIDRLNNMEQVLINDPSAGNYDVTITGHNVPMGPQEYFVVYEIITENLTLTYPNGGEKFKFGAREYIQWDAVNTTGSFDLEYSTDNGATWNDIATVGATTYLYQWAVPSDTPTGDALVRVTNGSHQDVSDATFNIARSPSPINITRVCETTATFEWNAVAGADTYDLYLLGDKYMEYAGSSNTTTITILIDDYTEEMWFGLVAKNVAEGWESTRSRAKHHEGGLLNCTIGIDENTVENLFSMYPNPATSEVHIEFSTSSYAVEGITISNSLGQVVGEIETNASSHITFDVSKYAQGIYFVTINAGERTSTKKLIIN